jgi:large conductance mechanosensitive channel
MKISASVISITGFFDSASGNNQGCFEERQTNRRLPMLKDFREFVMRGNVVDMAVGIVIGTAFIAVVKSLVSDLLMPPIGLLIGKTDFSNLYMVLKEGKIAGPYASLVDAQKAGAVTVNYGLFVNSIISLIIIAFAVFLLIRGINRLRRQEEIPAEPETMECKFCFSTISVKAVRCPHCTSSL